MDVKRLRKDAHNLKSARSRSPIGRAKTGATNVIRNNYLEIYRMHHEDEVQWTEIAAALAAQGVIQGDGEAITGRRLTALMRNIARQNEKETDKNSSRSQRKDLVVQQSASEGNQRTKLGLAAELTLRNEPEQQVIISEEDIRRNALERHAHLLKRK